MATNAESKSKGRANGQGGGDAEGAPSSASESTGKRGVMNGIQEKVTSRVDEQKNRAAEGIGSIADVIHHAGDELRMQNESLAALVDGASDQMRRFAEHIRQRGTGDLMNDVAEFGRRRPAMFIGGAFLIGLGVARFLKSSGERPDGETGTAYGGRFETDPMTTPVTTTYGTGGFGQAGTGY
jgi:hypothetical protein